MNWRDELAIAAEGAVARYLATHRSLRIDLAQPEYRGGTNHVTFGHADGRPVVFKYFVNELRFRNELFALKHFASTGLVPQALDVADERLIVMSRLEGQDIAASFKELSGERRA